MVDRLELQDLKCFRIRGIYDRHETRSCLSFLYLLMAEAQGMGLGIDLKGGGSSQYGRSIHFAADEHRIHMKAKLS